MTYLTVYKGENAAFLSKNTETEVCPLSQTAGLGMKCARSGFFYDKKPDAKQTLFFKNLPRIIAGGAVAAEKEAKGPIGEYFDSIFKESARDKNFESAEISMVKEAVNFALKKAGLNLSDIDLFLAGDLLNQITSSSYTARDLGLPYMGLYSACSTMTQSLLTAAVLVNAGYFNNILCATASHFATAERQYRFPLEYGAQRPPYAQRTVTGAGCSIVSSGGNGALITSATIGKVVDYGIDDLSNMGAAMAPAAMDTMYAMFKETDTAPEDYDLILTGDLGKLGSDILRDLMKEQGYFLGQNYADCGCIIYGSDQKVYQGGSGSGCSAGVFNSFILNQFYKNRYKKIAFLATGALMSVQSCDQGETIPCVSHGIILEA
jgi:stage V sporulation protein AD